MFSGDFSYVDLFTGMTIRGLLLGALFGTIYGTCLAPILGTIYGLGYGAIVGLGLGLGNGLLLIVISLPYMQFSRLRHYIQVCTLLTTIFSLVGGTVGFGMLWGARDLSFLGEMTPLVEIPALIAALITTWVTQGLTIDVEKRKRKLKEKPISTMIESEA